MLIWFNGILLTRLEARMRLVEYQQIGIQESQAHTLARMEKATRDMVNEVREIVGR